MSESLAWLDAFVSAFSRMDDIAAQMAASSPPERSALVDLCSAVTWRPGERMLRQGEDARELFLLVEGTVEAWQSLPAADGGAGAERLVNTLRPPDVLGEVGLVLRGPRITSVRAASPVRALGLKKRDLSVLVQSDPVVAATLFRWFAVDAVRKTERTGSVDAVLYPVGRPLDPSIPLGPGPQAQPSPARSQRRDAGLGPQALREALGALLRLYGFPWSPDLLPDGAARRLAAFEVGPGDVITGQGEEETALLLLVRGDGLVRDPLGHPIRAFDAGHPRPVHVVMGEYGFLVGGARQGTVVAGTSATVLALDRQDVVEFTRQAPVVSCMLHALSLRVAVRKLAETSELAARNRSIDAGQVVGWFEESSGWGEAR